MLRWVALQLRLCSLTGTHTMGSVQATEDLHRGRARRRLPLTAELWALAWPAILRNVLNCACDRLTLALVGHWDPSTVHYDGAGLGKMYSNITGLSVGLGLNLGLATLCSQAYGALTLTPTLTLALTLTLGEYGGLCGGGAYLQQATAAIGPIAQAAPLDAAAGQG